MDVAIFSTSQARNVSWALLAVALLALVAAFQFEQPAACALMFPFLVAEAWEHFREGGARRWLFRVVAGAVLSLLLFIPVWTLIAFGSALGDGAGAGHWGEFMISAFVTPAAMLAIALWAARFEGRRPTREMIVRAWLSSVVLAAICAAAAISLSALTK
jgi:hypothetical protein